MATDQILTINLDSVALEAFTHSCTELQIREILKDLRRTGRKRLRTHGHIALRRAIESNEDIGVVHTLLSQPDIQVNSRQADLESGNTVLHIAVLLRNKHAMRLLLNRKDLDPNVENRRGETPLHLAATPAGSCQDHLDILELLANDPRVSSTTLNRDEQTPFHIACNLNPGRRQNLGSVSKEVQASGARIEIIVSAVVKNNKSLFKFVTQRDVFGRTALHYAAESGMSEVVSKVLNELGLQSSDLNELVLAQDHKGCLAVHLAAQQGHLAVLRLLQSFVHCKDHNGLTTLHYAIRSGRRDIVEVCLELHCPPPDYTLLPTVLNLYLELLTMTTHHDIAVFLLMSFYVYISQSERVASPKELSPSLLHWTVHYNDKDGHGAALIGHILKWQPMKANEFLHSAKEQTSLHIATILENVNAVRVLCSESGWYLDANQRDANNNTALHYAFETNNKDICRILLQRADVKEHLCRLHKYRESYVRATNVILVVTVLIASMTYVNCPSQREATENEMKESSKRYRLADTLNVTRIAFLMSMTSTILASFAALPFSFGFFFQETSGDNYIGKSVKRTRVLIVSASYLLVLAVVGVTFTFICSKYIYPYIEYYDCELACEIVIYLFFVITIIFLGTNIIRYWNKKRRSGKSSRGWRPLGIFE